MQYVPELFVPEAFEEYLLCRDVIYDEYTRMITDEYGQIKDEMEGYSIAERLHDIPMLQIISNINIFSNYINAYEKLLAAINVEFPKISTMIAQSVAKDIVNYIMAMDYVFVVGESKFHAMPTPMNPMYLWKYVRLAEEILESKGIDGSELASINEDDKSFIIRKAEDIPEPVSIVMMTKMLREEGAVYLPIAGKLGNLPIYSTQPQIDEGNSGIEVVKQSVVRYMCLYPHASMMLRITFVNPPSVENVIAMLKKLDAERDLGSFGVDISIYRTKEAPSHWVEITDKSLQEGLLGKIKNGKNMHFSLNIKNETIAYNKLLLELGKKKQHLIVVFDPNEKEIRTAKSERYNHIHPLCVPMVYQYNPFKDEVDIRPSNEGGIFSYYSSILEKLNEHSSSFAHTSIFSRSPIGKETYNSLLESTDWMIILDQNLKSWDISLQSESEKLFYKEDECRSIGIYSKNSRKFSLGYKKTIENLGNYIATEKGLENIIKTIRSINDDGLLSIVSHSTNRIFDDNHGKGSLGLGIVAISYLKGNSDALLVGLDTQLAREWLSERDEDILPDLIGINIRGDDIRVDLMEVKTGNGDFRICGKQISGHAVEQVCVLDKLIKEIFGRSEKITTVSRREILRHHVFESLYSAELTNTEKHNMTEKLNQLFAGELDLKIRKNIVFVNFNSADTKSEIFEAGDSLVGNKIIFTEIGSSDIQKILSGISVEKNLFLQTEQANEIFVNSENEYDAPEIDKDVLEPFLEENDEKAEDTAAGVLKIVKFNDGFRFSNPGSLKLPKEQIYKGGESKARNPHMQTMLRMVGFGDNAGSGFPDILKIWSDNGWEIPELMEDTILNQVTLILKYKTDEVGESIFLDAKMSEEDKKTERGLSEDEKTERRLSEDEKTERGLSEDLSEVMTASDYKKVEAIILYLEDNKYVTPQIAEKLTGKSAPTVRRYLKMLVETGYVKVDGSTSNIKYVI